MIGLPSSYTRKTRIFRILRQSPRLPPSQPRANIPHALRGFPNIPDDLRDFPIIPDDYRAFPNVSESLQVLQLRKYSWAHTEEMRTTLHFVTQTRNRSRTSCIPAFYPL